MTNLSLSASIDRFLKWSEANNAPATVYGYRLYLGRFLKWCGDVPLAAISPAMVTSWSRKFHPVQAVQRLLSWCQKEERSLAVNPLENMRKIGCGSRSRILNRGECSCLLRSSSPAFRRFLVGLRETFARPQELRKVRPIDILTAGGVPASDPDIRRGRSFFRIEAGKGFDRRSDKSEARIIPISPRLGRLLLRLMRGGAAADAPVFLNARGKPWTANAVRCRLRRLRERIGLGADRRGERVVAYTLRHTGATSAARAGLRDWTLAAVLGHATTRTTARYVHLQAGDVLDAMGRLWEVKTAERRKNDLPDSRRKRSE